MKLKNRLKLAWSIIRAGDQGNMLSHARNELALALPDVPKDKTSSEWNRAMREHVETMVFVFGLEGHSGFSARVATQLLTKLFDFEPLTPLTGRDDEWNEITGFADGPAMWQNKRCSKIFKEVVNGRVECYNIEGYVFEEPDGARFTGWGSRRSVAFPHTPNDPIVVKVDEAGVPIASKYKRLRERPTAVELVE